MATTAFHGHSRSHIAYGIAPYFFILMWSTGFVGARYGLPYAEPLTLLIMRFALTVLILILVALAIKTTWPKTRAEAGHLAIVGILAHAGYLGTNFYAMSIGMPLAIVALVGGLQPVLTALLAGPLLGERLSPRAWIGLILGLGGVVLVLSPKLGTYGMSITGVACVAAGLLAMTAATIHQKRYCQTAPLLSGMIIQLFAALAVLLAASYWLETHIVNWQPQLVLAIAWLAIVLSIGAITILWLLVRRGEASKVTSMFYLIPPVTALLAYLLFGEGLSVLTLAGMAISAGGVALVTAKPTGSNI